MGNPFIIAEDLALKTYLSGITVADDKNASRPVKVWYGFPDIEIRAQDFPYITIDLIDIVAAEYRQTYGYLVDTDYNGTIAPTTDYVYDFPVPVAYDLIYQVSSFCRHPRHDRAIMYQLLNKFPSKYGYLTVPNQLGTESSNRSMFLDGFVKRDTVDSETGNRRLLRNALSIRIVSEMTPAQAIAATQIIQSTHINTTTTNIPDGFTPLSTTVTTNN